MSKKNDYIIISSVIVVALLIWFLFEIDKRDQKIKELEEDCLKRLKDVLKHAELSDELRKQILTLVERNKNIKPKTAFELTKILSLIEIKENEKAISSVIEALESILKDFYGISGNLTDPFELIQQAHKAQLISNQELHTIELLKNYRNAMVHNQPIPIPEQPIVASSFVAGLEIVLKLDKIAKQRLFTIGYGDRKIEDFKAILKRYRVQYVIDVRSKPFSKYNIEYNKNELDKSLADDNIKYVFMGDSLGGRPDDLSCYIDGKVDYQELKKKSYFIEGLEKIRKLSTQNIRMALMCSEIRPEDCHRTKLIGQELEKLNSEVIHIDEKGNFKLQDDVMHIVTKGASDTNLFGEEYLTSRKKYVKANGAS